MRLILSAILILTAGCSLVGYEEKVPDTSTVGGGTGGKRDGGDTSFRDGAMQSLPDGSTGAGDSGQSDSGTGGGHNGDAQIAKDSGTPITKCETSTCDLSCPPGATDCKLECRQAQTCAAECALKGTCSLDCHDAGRCDITCGLDADCSVDCRGVDDCRARCLAGSECSIDCREGAHCKDFVCALGASCTMKCDVGETCGFQQCPDQKACPDGAYYVCNATCP